MLTRSLTDHHLQFLAELHENPLWQEILQSLPAPQPPRYRVSRTKADHESAVGEWIYQSGRMDEREEMLSFLSGSYKE